MNGSMTPAGHPSGVVAAVDCGTNSTRLLVAASDGRTLDRRMRITRLGQGVDASGRLSPEGIERTLEALAEYRTTMDELGVVAMRAVATSAARDAENSADFFQQAAGVLGFRPELLSGEEEGRLSFVGATAELDPSTGPFLVLDIGGGSTEFVVGTSEAEGTVSLDIGCVRLTEKFLLSDPPAAEELSQALSVTRDHLDDVVRELPAVLEARTLVGLAGTVSAVACVEMGLPAYDRERVHHFLLSRAAVEDVFRTLATESRSARVHNPGLEEARADVIVGGVLILAAVMRSFDIDECLVSESDILDGIVGSLLDREGARASVPDR